MNFTTISIEEAAVRLNIGRTAAYQMAQRGDLPTVKAGRRRRRVPLTLLEEMIRQAGQPREER